MSRCVCSVNNTLCHTDRACVMSAGLQKRDENRTVPQTADEGSCLSKGFAWLLAKSVKTQNPALP